MSVRIEYISSFQRVLRTFHESVSGIERKSSGLTRMRRSRHVVQAAEALCRRVFGLCLICDSSDEVCSSLTIVEGFILELASLCCVTTAEAVDGELYVDSSSE